MTTTTVAFDARGSAIADFSANTEVNFTWGDWGFRKIEFDLFNVSQSGSTDLISMRVSTNGGSTYDAGNNYKTNGLGKWIEGIFEIATTNETAQTVNHWPITVDMGDSATYGTCGKVSILTAGVAGGTNVHSSYTATINRTDSGNVETYNAQGGFYIGAAGSKINAVKFLFASDAETMSGTIMARGIV